MAISICLLVVAVLEVKKNSESISQDAMRYMPATNRVILLDAGHGGIDPGA